MAKLDAYNIQYVNIPISVYLDKDLTPLDKLIFAEIHLLDGKFGCTASNETLAEFTCSSTASVSRAKRKLLKKEYIYAESFDGRKKVFHSNFDRKNKKMIKQTYQNDKADDIKMIKQTYQNDKAPIYKDNKYENINKKDKPSHGKSKSNLPNERYIQLSKTLDEIISSHLGNKKSSIFKIQNEAYKLQELTTQDGISITQIKKVLNFYKENIGNEYVPCPVDAQQFRWKFKDLQKAMIRQESDLTETEKYQQRQNSQQAEIIEIQEKVIKDKYVRIYLFSDDHISYRIFNLPDKDDVEDEFDDNEPEWFNDDGIDRDKNLKCFKNMKELSEFSQLDEQIQDILIDNGLEY